VTASLAAALAIAVGYAAVSGTAGVALVLHTLLALLVGFVAYLVALALLATTKRRGGQKDVRVKRT
jgi:hypothetical protein